MPADETRGRAFLDTNVLLYAYDASAGSRHARAASLVGDLAHRRLAVTSVQVLQEFYVNATRKIVEPLSAQAALERLDAFGRWPTHAPTARDVISAASLSAEAQLSFWDAMIITSAAELGCSVLWTEDLNDGQQIAGVRIGNPFASKA